MSENYRIGTSRGPIVFIKQEPLRNAKPDNLTPKQVSQKAKQADIVVVEVNGKIKIIETICATAILGKAQSGDYPHVLHYPQITKNGRINGYKNPLVVISDKKGTKSVVKGSKAQSIINGKVPSGFEVEFIPPRLRK